jgi:hypothetical protein
LHQRCQLRLYQLLVLLASCHQQQEQISLAC